MAKVTNEQASRRGFYAGGDLVWLKPGESKEIDLTADEAERAARHDVLKVEGVKPEAPKK